MVTADPVEVEGAEEGGVSPDWSLLTKQRHFALGVKKIFHLNQKKKVWGGGGWVERWGNNNVMQSNEDRTIFHDLPTVILSKTKALALSKKAHLENQMLC